jgi:hypothetical protein
MGGCELRPEYWRPRSHLPSSQIEVEIDSGNTSTGSPFIKASAGSPVRAIEKN